MIYLSANRSASSDAALDATMFAPPQFFGSNNRKDPTVTMDVLTAALLISAVLYIFCLVLARRKLAVLNRYRPGLSTQKLLLLSVALVSVMRIMTILGVAAMNVANVRAHYKLSPQSSGTRDDSSSDHYNGDDLRDRHQLFYDKSMTVLFDLPNCMVVSTYVLLTLVWAECFVKARLHTESAATLKRTWLIYFMIFNSLLYVLQLTLYGSLFLAPPTKMVRSVIYVGISEYNCFAFLTQQQGFHTNTVLLSAGINFTAVLLVLIFYVYLNIRFSVRRCKMETLVISCLWVLSSHTTVFFWLDFQGFPYRSQRLRVSLTRVSKAMTLWSFTRVIWGIATLLVFVYKIELLQDSNTPVWSFAVLLLMFFVCEILPIIALLDYSYLSLVGLERVEIRWEEGEEEEGSLITQETPSLPTTIEPLTTASSPVRSVRWQDDALVDPLLPHGEESVS
jgi:hypothetical protein